MTDPLTREALAEWRAETATWPNHSDRRDVPISDYQTGDDTGEMEGRDAPLPMANPADKPAPKPLRIISPSSLTGQPPARRWIVPDWLPCGVVTGLSGDGGIGKSLLAQQLQTSTALGTPWVGLPVERCSSLAIFCEDSAEELWRRQRDIARDYGVDMSELKDAHWISRLGDDNALMLFARNGVGELTPFHKQILTAARDLEARLVVVDTAADVFAGNENDRGQVRQFVARALGGIALAIDGAVLVLLHPSRSGLASGEGDGGSTGWNNSFRSRLFFSAPAAEDGEKLDPNARILQRKKANYAARGAELRLVWRDGVIRPETPEPEPQPGMTAAGKIDALDLFLALVREFADQNRTVSAKERSGNYAPRVFGELPKAQRHGFGRSHFQKAMEQAFKARRIANVPYGPPSKAAEKIVVAGDPQPASEPTNTPTDEESAARIGWSSGVVF